MATLQAKSPGSTTPRAAENADIEALMRLNQRAVNANAGVDVLDTAILLALGEGDKVIGVNAYGKSLWAETRRIDVETVDGTNRSYFLKTLSVPDAAERVYGEYEAMSAVWKTMSSIAPKPRGFGPCDGQKSTYFFVCDYLNLTHELPDPVDLRKKLSEFHLSSESPTGQFGFYCTTFDGKNPLNTTWDLSWTSYFRRLMEDIYKIEKAANGCWKEFDDVIQITLDRLIPRLLDALVADGRTIKPTLIHGDLWESNIGTDEQTDEIFIYDACAYYAHHEKEVDEKYRREYFKHYPPSEPREEADDRNRLYAAQTMIVTSLDFPEQRMRELIMSDLNYLIDKYELRD
ncbi:Uu.00g077850.m01.CDS01 [Anthostomella pinea]|uniref:protein-ribulosamine 3-kinase n=1 Tax=Anthostomella pinea TaxID=933095 RepID=A0AAI8YGN8_9PEZI|nr:Uu.00g077850.m01.CDS01 [Anthostomella pinea]